MFSSGSLSSISLATVTPSFVIVGEPNFLSRTTFRPFGPSVILTASASMFTPRRMACRDSSPWTICFAGGCENSENFVFAENQVFVVVHFDFSARILSEQNPIPFLHFERNHFPV